MQAVQSQMSQMSLSNTPKETYFTTKSKNGHFQLYKKSTCEAVENISGIENVRTSVFSKEKQYLAYVTPSHIVIIDLKTIKEVFRVQETCIYLCFSPLDTQLVTWNQFTSSSTAASAAESSNLKVWDIASKTVKYSKVSKRADLWQPQYTSDESLIGFLVHDGVELYNPNAFINPMRKIAESNIVAFSISQNRDFKIAVFIKASGSSPGAAKIYSKRNLQTPSATATFFKADAGEVSWNKNGTHLLIVTRTDFDTTNKSYYGESLLFYMDAAGKRSSAVKLPKEGPVHQAEWHPTHDQFVVIYGFTPPKATLFDLEGRPVFDFGTGNRNTVKFSPDGKTVVLAGFGNMRGEMEYYDLENMKLISKFTSSDTTYWEFFPDCEHLLMATTSPRLRVNNGIRLHHYNGTLLHKKDFEELTAVQVQALHAKHLPKDRAIIAQQQNTAEVKKESWAYRPPSARSIVGRSTTIDMGHEKPKALVSGTSSQPIRLPPGMSMEMYNKMKASTKK